ncbi:hypothetical protein J3R73_004864 [Labrys monachus]|uniref:Uncharacterized protein n=1 Tax=Labrys monachus TaxID=217067 RepID=A0ABU0FL30_9HYPH|nr:hypothetical protein [Labrys monachus]
MDTGIGRAELPNRLLAAPDAIHQAAQSIRTKQAQTLTSSLRHGLLSLGTKRGGAKVRDTAPCLPPTPADPGLCLRRASRIEVLVQFRPGLETKDGAGAGRDRCRPPHCSHGRCRDRRHPVAPGVRSPGRQVCTRGSMRNLPGSGRLRACPRSRARQERRRPPAEPSERMGWRHVQAGSPCRTPAAGKPGPQRPRPQQHGDPAARPAGCGEDISRPPRPLSRRSVGEACASRLASLARKPCWDVWPVRRGWQGREPCPPAPAMPPVRQSGSGRRLDPDRWERAGLRRVACWRARPGGKGATAALHNMRGPLPHDHRYTLHHG